jgi:hypothetical protein
VTRPKILAAVVVALLLAGVTAAVVQRDDPAEVGLVALPPDTYGTAVMETATSAADQDAAEIGEPLAIEAADPAADPGRASGPEPTARTAAPAYVPPTRTPAKQPFDYESWVNSAPYQECVRTWQRDDDQAHDEAGAESAKAGEPYRQRAREAEARGDTAERDRQLDEGRRVSGQVFEDYYRPRQAAIHAVYKDCIYSLPNAPERRS